MPLKFKQISPNNFKLIMESSIENRNKRIEIASKKFLEHYLEPVIDVSEEIAYNINNTIGTEDFISGQDIRSSIYNVDLNNLYNDTILRIESSIYDNLYLKWEIKNKDMGHPPEYKTKQWQELSNKIVKSLPNMTENLQVIIKCIPMLRKFNILNKQLSVDPKLNQ